MIIDGRQVYLIRSRDALEAVFRGLISAIGVGMVLHSQFPVCFLDVLRRAFWIETEYFVQVLVLRVCFTDEGGAQEAACVKCET